MPLNSPVVDLFVPCFIDQVRPQIAWATIKVLQKAGCRVRYKAKQTCCGQPAYNAGFWKEACSVAEKFIRDFDDENAYVVSPSASCIGMIRNAYTDILKNEKILHKYYSLQKRAFELTEFLVDVLGIEKLGEIRFPHRVTYHDSCSALRECYISEAPRKLLQNIQGLELVEIKSNETCCGFGGTFAVKFPAISEAMAEQKLENASQTMAEYVVSTDFSCLMHLESYAQKNNISLKFLHIAEILSNDC
ncbi:MAG: (Fe-S)-binding protein [Raineya sp.]|nr:(Fe-S)-binding protein [Raineya sp.]MDW8296427.1 (Fe-S)-binding protein [Raineya sp.]